MVDTTLRAPERHVQHLMVGPVEADYSLARSELTGSWVALGTIRWRHNQRSPPAWVLTGIGETPLEAVNDLRSEIQAHARSRCAVQDA